MITVLIATGVMNAGGAETLIMELLRKKQAHMRYVLLIHHSGPVAEGVYDAEIRALGVPMYYIPAVGAVGMRRYTKLFRERVLEIGGVDILHSHLNAIGGIIARAAEKAGIRRRIIHCHADITYTGSRRSIAVSELKLRYLKRYVRRFGTDFWACSEAAGRRLFDSSPAVVIPNVIDVPRYLGSPEKTAAAKRRLGLTQELILGAVGRIAPIKNYELALETLAVLRKQGVDAAFVCYGRVANEDYYRRLCGLTEERKLSEYVHFPGNSEKISEDMAAFDVFLMPSKSEGFGMAAIEAQAAGIPAAVSTGVPEIVDVGLGTIRFLPPDPEQWAQAISELRQAVPPDRERILAAFRQHGFDAACAVQDIEKRYREICPRQEEG